MEPELIQDYFISCCSQPAFKKFVRNAIKEDLDKLKNNNHDQMVNKLSLQVDQQIKNTVNYEFQNYSNQLEDLINNYLTQAVYQEVQNMVRVETRNTMNQFDQWNEQLKTTRREFNRQITDHQMRVDQQNRQVEQMLNKQKNQLALMMDQHDDQINRIIGDQEKIIINRVQRRVEQVITDIINQRGYHQINQVYFEDFKNRTDIELDDFRTSWVKELRNHKSNLETELLVLKDRGNMVVNQINNDYQNQLAELQQNLMQSQNNLKKIKSLESEIAFFKYTLYGLVSSAFLGLSIYLVMLMQGDDQFYY